MSSEVAAEQRSATDEIARRRHVVVNAHRPVVEQLSHGFALGVGLGLLAAV